MRGERARGQGTIHTSESLQQAAAQMSAMHSSRSQPPAQSPTAEANGRSPSQLNLGVRPAAEVATSAKELSDRQAALAYGLPVGPLDPAIESSTSLKTFLNTYTGDVKTMGGGFTVRCDKSQVPAGKKGTVVSVICNKCSADSRWTTRWEWAYEGWTLYQCNLIHCGHSLDQCQEAVMATGAGRDIPKELDRTGNLMARAGLGAKDIYKVFALACMDEGNMPTFTYRDIWNTYKRVMPKERAQDACKLVEQLAARKATDGLEYFVESDGGRIDRIFVECRNARKIWMAGMVLFYDPTFGTNSFDLKLTMFVTVNKDGRSVLLAYMLHHSEDYDDVFWGFRCFHQVFALPPASVLTDSGAGIMKAVAKMTMQCMPWYETASMLCIYHLDQNFYENVHPIFAHDADMWKCVHDMFWTLAKQGDAEICDMNAAFCEMMDYISANGKGKTKEKVLKWVQDVLFAKGDMWVASKTWATFSAGAHATSRAESMNAAIKGWLGAGLTMQELDSRVDQYNQLKEYRDTCKYHAEQLATAAKRGKSSLGSVPLFIGETETYLTPYAYQLLCAQLGLMFAYKVDIMPDEDVRSNCKRLEPAGTNYLVTLVQQSPVGVTPVSRKRDGRTATHENKADLGLQDVSPTHWVCLPGFEDRRPWCSCQYPTSYGAPCRHLIAARYYVNPHGSGGEQFKSLFAQQWMKDTACLPCVPAGRASASEYTPDDKTACYADAVSKMRINGFKPRVLSEHPVDISAFDDTFMMLKYGKRNQGGWHVAHMTATDDKDVMQLHFCFSDNKSAEWLCTPPLMVKLPLKADREEASRSWFLLEKLEPEQPSTGTGIGNPSTSRSVGAPQRKRKAPAQGPLSR